MPQNIIDSIKSGLEQAYNSRIVVLVNKELPQNAFVNIKSPRYRADSLLKDLLFQLPDSVSQIIGVTMKDISTTKRDNWGNVKQPEWKYLDWGVFGLGYQPGRSCVVSTYRLSAPSESLMLDRIKKVSIHEIGHNKGLKHCASEKCVMQDAVESIATVDAANFSLCLRCQNKK